MHTARARRITIYQDAKGEWRYRAQAGNWQVIESSEEGFRQKRTVLARVAARYPGVEVIER